VLLDLDGTLSDPKAGIVACFRYAFERLGRPPPEPAVVAPWIGPPLRLIFSHLLQTEDRDLVERAVALYRERYAETGWREAKVYPGVPEGLQALKAQGWSLLVVTSKAQVFAERIVQHFGFADAIARVYGAELGGRFDDKRELMRHVLVETRLLPENAVMVGDRKEDVLAAGASGVPAVGVLYGYGSREELLSAGAATVCSSLSAVCAWLQAQTSA
jgi:phosphoglycolate phosphatase